MTPTREQITAAVLAAFQRNASTHPDGRWGAMDPTIVSAADGEPGFAVAACYSLVKDGALVRVRGKYRPS